MAKDHATWATKALFFEGRSWPSARVVGRRELYGQPSSGAASDLEPISIALIETSGLGRSWKATEALGFWRSFSETDLNSDAAIEDFVRRHGDPDSLLSPKVAVHTGDWEQPLSLCKTIAEVWVKPDANGISHCPHNPPRMVHGLLDRHVEKNVLAHTQPIFDPEFGIRLKPDNLAAFMVLSAVTMLFEKTPLRRCAHCEDWMSFSRSTAKTCASPAATRFPDNLERRGRTDELLCFPERM